MSFALRSNALLTHCQMSCFPEMYTKMGIHNHRSCASNIAEAMQPYGMGSYLEVTDPFNLFQNT